MHPRSTEANYSVFNVKCQNVAPEKTVSEKTILNIGSLRGFLRKPSAKSKNKNEKRSSRAIRSSLGVLVGKRSGKSAET